MASHVALLRGINVGGKHKLPMKQLVEIFEGLGCTEVTTYIQSGNIVFRAKVTPARQIADAVSEEIARRFGYQAPVVLRRPSELREVLARNPFLKAGMDTKMLCVGFLATRASASKVRSLDPDRSPPDTFAIRGREIYLCCPNGMARTKLTNQYFDAKLETICTIRNWATLRKLVDMTAV